MLVAIVAFALPSTSSAATVAELQAQINALLAQIAALQGNNTSPSTSTSATLTATVTAPYTAQFTYVMNQARSCNGGTYLLDYGDGKSESLQFPADACNSYTQHSEHSYARSGTYTASLYNNAAGKGGVRIGTVTITVGTRLPSCTITSNQSEVAMGEEYTIKWRSKNMPGTVLYEQIKGGGTVEVSARGTKTYEADYLGEHTYELGYGGLSASYNPVCSVTVNVVDGDTNADLEIDDVGVEVNDPVSGTAPFTVSVTGHVKAEQDAACPLVFPQTGLSWGDGSSSSPLAETVTTSRNGYPCLQTLTTAFSHTYTTPGTYTVDYYLRGYTEHDTTTITVTGSTAAPVITVSPVTSTTVYPTIKGTAKGTSAVVVVIASAANDKVYASGKIAVSKNAWEHTVTQAIPNGNYQTNVYNYNAGDVIFARAPLTVNASSSTRVLFDGGTYGTNRPTLTGTASGVTGFTLVATGLGDKYAEYVPVSNGRWSHSVTASFANGTYGLEAYTPKGELLGSGSFRIASEEAKPYCIITPSSTSIVAGQSVTISWASGNTSYVLYGGEKTAASGSFTETPSATKTYSMTAYGYTGGKAGCSATVNVASAPKTPVVAFSASPTSVPQGKPVTLNWTTENATGCVLQYGTTEQNVATGGTLTMYPKTSTSYRLICTNDPGTGKDGPTTERTVSVGVFQYSQTSPQTSPAGSSLGANALEAMKGQLDDIARVLSELLSH